MFENALKGALVLTFAVSACSVAAAEIDAAQITKRKEVIHKCLLKIYVDQRKRPQAIAEYQIITTMEPNDAAMRCKFGQYLAQGGTPADYNAAIVQLKKAIQIDPSNPTYQGILGSLYLKIKNVEEAVKYLRNGGPEYKKTYEESWKYLQGVKQHNEMKKRQEEQKKLQQQQQKSGDGAKKGGDDDDDDW